MTYWCFPLPPPRTDDDPRRLGRSGTRRDRGARSTPTASAPPRRTRSRCGSLTNSRDPLHARRTGLVDHDVLVGDDAAARAAQRGRAARRDAAGSRGWSGGRTARCPPRTSRTAATRPARATRDQFVEDRSPQVVGHDDRRARPGRDRDRRADLEVALDELDASRRRAGRRRRTRSRSSATTGCPRSANHRVWRPPPHATSHTRPPGTTDAPNRSIHADGFIRRGRLGRRSPPRTLDHHVGEQQDHRQPRQVVDRREPARPVEVGRRSRSGTAAPPRTARHTPSATGAPSDTRKRVRGTHATSATSARREQPDPPAARPRRPRSRPRARRPRSRAPRPRARRHERVRQRGHASSSGSSWLVVDRMRGAGATRARGTATARPPTPRSRSTPFRCGVHVSVTEKEPDGGSTSQPLA